MATLAWIDTGKRDPEIDTLVRTACAKANAQATVVNYPDGSPALESGSWKYPNGNWAFFGPGYEGEGSWKYPDGNWAFFGAAYEGEGSWKYPNGNWAFFGPRYEGAGSWKYPDGTFAFFGPSYEGAGSWKYPDGGWAFYGPAYEAAGSWKYPNGDWAFYGPGYEQTGFWYYPGGDVARDGKTRTAYADTNVMIDLVVAKKVAKKLKTSSIPGWRKAHKDVKVLILLRWLHQNK